MLRQRLKYPHFHAEQIQISVQDILLKHFEKKHYEVQALGVGPFIALAPLSKSTRDEIFLANN